MLRLLVALMINSLIFFVLFQICLGENETDENNEKEDTIEEGTYDRLFKEWKKNYDRRIRPYTDEKPVDVDVFLYVISMRSVSEVTMDFQLELYFREYWKDPRLAFSRERFNNTNQISLHESLAELLWVPDTFFPNAIYSNNPDPNSVSHRSLLRLEPDGHLLYSRRLSVTAECPMDLSLYPFDQQICRLSIESYGHDIRDLKYQWTQAGDPVAINERMELPEFELKKVITRARNITLATGTYSRLECCFFFGRNAGFYFVQLFIPAIAIVITSWLSLWMEKESTFGDMIQVILAITFLYYSYNTVMPKVSYIKAMDIFLGTCFIFVFLSLIKLAILKHLKILTERNNNSSGQDGTRNSRKRRIFEKPLQTKLLLTSIGVGNVPMKCCGNLSLECLCNDEFPLMENGFPLCIKNSLKQKRRGRSVEFGSEPLSSAKKVSRIFRSISMWLFPSMFVGFCTFYFYVYFRYTEENEDERCLFGI